MSLLTNIKNWANQYKTRREFISHKISHMIAGCVATLLFAFFTGYMLLALLLATVVGVVKELKDTHSAGISLNFNNLADIVVTTLGGFIGLMVAYALL
jgi:hypothetical protein